MNEQRPSVYDLLNAQTGKAQWYELEKHFARGVLLWVDRSLDLIEVAGRLVQDHSETVNELRQAGLLCRVRDDDALRWQKADTVFWTVVVAPWVLIQEIPNVSTGPE